MQHPQYMERPEKFFVRVFSDITDLAGVYGSMIYGYLSLRQGDPLSYEEIARSTRLKVRTVIRHTNKLESKGLIEVSKKRGHVNRYRCLEPGDRVSHDRESPVTESQHRYAGEAVVPSDREAHQEESKRERREKKPTKSSTKTSSQTTHPCSTAPESEYAAHLCPDCNTILHENTPDGIPYCNVCQKRVAQQPYDREYAPARKVGVVPNDPKDKDMANVATKVLNHSLDAVQAEILQLRGETPKKAKPRTRSSWAREAQTIYDAYPRQVARRTALSAIQSALTRVAKQKGVTDPAATLLDIVKKYSKSVIGKQRKHVPHPATWFNGDSWLNEDKDGEGLIEGQLSIDKIPDAPCGCPATTYGIFHQGSCREQRAFGLELTGGEHHHPLAECGCPIVNEIVHHQGGDCTQSLIGVEKRRRG